MTPARVRVSVTRVADERGRLAQLRQAEVRQLRVAALRDQDVLGLDVTMQNAGVVRRGQTIGDADDQLDDVLPRPWARLDPVPERAAVNELGDQVLAPVELAGVMDREDVGMIERGCELRFALEAPPGRRVGQIGGEKLDRDGAIELGIRRAIDRAHPAFAKLVIEAICADRRARRERAHDRKDTKMRRTVASSGVCTPVCANRVRRPSSGSQRQPSDQ